MIVDASLRTAYPELAEWIGENLPRVRQKSLVWRAFLKWSQLSESNATAAVQPGCKPFIKAKEMHDANGEFVGGLDPDTIYIAASICQRFAQDQDKRRMKRLVESTLLHEMVHWGDWQDGHDQGPEEGTRFERAAYGRDIQAYF